MNERIKKLATQAKMYVDLNGNPWPKCMSAEECEVAYAKFAELIVWEAIGLCRVDVDALTAPFLPEYEKGIVEGYRRANENLRVYFGVEE